MFRHLDAEDKDEVCLQQLWHETGTSKPGTLDVVERTAGNAITRLQRPWHADCAYRSAWLKYAKQVQAQPWDCRCNINVDTGLLYNIKCVRAGHQPDAATSSCEEALHPTHQRMEPAMFYLNHIPHDVRRREAEP